MYTQLNVLFLGSFTSRPFPEYLMKCD